MQHQSRDENETVEGLSGWLSVCLGVLVCERERVCVGRGLVSWMGAGKVQ